MPFENKGSGIQYRPEIDGLRSIAIIPILMFHFGYTLFSGGFTGVDIFFVISGYLITSIISKELNQGNFTFQKFYLRRAKRILPLLFLVLLTCVPFAWLVMLPNELASFGDSLVNAARFTANIYFKHAIDYFSPSSDQIPLLHIWSLAVEEQFYLVFPFIIIKLHKRRIGMIKSFSILILLSFITSIFASHYSPSKNFYYFPTRAWEFLFGAIAVTVERKINFSFRYLDDFLCFVGLILIGYGIFILTDQATFPGINALFPVLGTFLLITFAKPKTMVASYLSSNPIKFIGKISYGLYLWHFPILVFNNFLHLRYAIFISPILLILCTLTLSVLSYFYIETPIRFNKISTKNIVVGLSSAFLLLLCLGYTLGHFTSFYKKFNAQQIQFLQKSAQTNLTPSFGDCNKNNIEKPCQLNMGSSNKQALLIGDSHAYTLFHPLAKELLKRDIDLGLTLQLNGNCPPLFTENKKYLSNDCLARNNMIFKKITTDDNIKTIIIFSRWTWYIEGTPFNNGRGGIGEKSNNFLKYEYSNIDERHTLFNNLYRNTFEVLARSGKEIIIVNTAPEPGWNVPKQILNSLYSNKDYSDLTFGFKRFQERNYNVDLILNPYKTNEQNNNFKVVDPSHLFCDEARNICHLTLNKIPLYTDDNHLSDLGASLVSSEIVKLMN